MMRNRYLCKYPIEREDLLKKRQAERDEQPREASSFIRGSMIIDTSFVPCKTYIYIYQPLLNDLHPTRFSNSYQNRKACISSLS